MVTTVFNIVRVLLGLFMMVIGTNKFFEFIPIPSPPGDGGDLMKIYMSSGFLRLIGVLEFIGGLGLVSDKFLPISLTLITAIMFNAFLFHVLHDLSGIGPAAICLILAVMLVFANSSRFDNYFGM